jgi:hypothetical protein
MFVEMSVVNIEQLATTVAIVRHCGLSVVRSRVDDFSQPPRTQ